MWNSLKERYEHQITVILPKACYDWMHLRLQDFKSVSEYNSAIFRISSQLQLFGEKITDEDMLEKTFSTFHASNVLLQQQYREKCFTKYSELISCLLVAEQNNELLMKNHEARLSGSAPFPEVNVCVVKPVASHIRVICYRIHFREWSRTSWTSLMIFHQKLIVLFGHKKT